MLAVVQDQEQRPNCEEVNQLVSDRLLERRVETERRGDHPWYQGWILQRRQLHEPDPVGVLADPPAGDSERQPRLPGPACTGESQETPRLQETTDVGALALSPHEARKWRRQIMARHAA